MKVKYRTKQIRKDFGGMYLPPPTLKNSQAHLSLILVGRILKMSAILSRFHALIPGSCEYGITAMIVTNLMLYSLADLKREIIWYA